jgi:hypothetical protein
MYKYNITLFASAFTYLYIDYNYMFYDSTHLI